MIRCWLRFAMPAALQLQQRLQNRMSIHPGHDTFWGIEGNKIEGDIYGNGARTALLLDSGGETRHAWCATARRLAECGFTAIAVDQRGHGTSDWMDGGAYALEDYGRDAVLLGREIEQRFGSRPAAIGASLGGLTALYALGQDVCSSALVLVDVTPRVEASGVAQRDFMRVRATDGFVSIDEAAELVAAYLPHRTKQRSTDGLRKNLTRRADGALVLALGPSLLGGPRSVHAADDALHDRLEEIARNLTVPTLLVRCGSSDVVLSRTPKDSANSGRMRKSLMLAVPVTWSPGTRMTCLLAPSWASWGGARMAAT